MHLHHAAILTDLTELLYGFLPASGAPKTWQHAAKDAGLEQAWRDGGSSKGPLIRALLEAGLAGNVFERFIGATVRLALDYRRYKRNPIRKDEIEKLADLVEQLGHPIRELREHRFVSQLAPAPTVPPPAVEPTAAPVSAPSIVVDDRLARERAAALDALLATFFQLDAMENRQAAGQALNSLLSDLFGHFDLHPTEAFRVVGEEIDGAFVFEGESYLVEAKWTKPQTQVQPLYAFDGKVERKSHYTRGLFISINGYTEDALAAYEKGSPRSVLIDGAHLFRVLSGAMSLADLIAKVMRVYTQRGAPYTPVSEL